MRIATCITGFFTVMAIAAFAARAQEKAGPPVTLKAVKYAGLADTVLQNRGKVVVVDLWGFF